MELTPALALAIPLISAITPGFATPWRALSLVIAVAVYCPFAKVAERQGLQAGAAEMAANK